MDVFNLRRQLIDDYSTYISSFINIKDERIYGHVHRELEAGTLWPDPLIQLNPTFEPGAWIDELVNQGVLHPLCRDIFRLKSAGGKSDPLRLHKHQTDAITAAQSGDNYVLTTGTGSGKAWPTSSPLWITSSSGAAAGAFRLLSSIP